MFPFWKRLTLIATTVFLAYQFYITLRTPGKQGVWGLNSRLRGKKSAFNLFFDCLTAGLCQPTPVASGSLLTCLLLYSHVYLAVRSGGTAAASLDKFSTSNYLFLKSSHAALYEMGTEKADCLKKLTCHLQFKINGIHFSFLPEVWLLSFSRSFWELASLGSLLSATGAQHRNPARGKTAQGSPKHGLIHKHTRMCVCTYIKCMKIKSL